LIRDEALLKYQENVRFSTLIT